MPDAALIDRLMPGDHVCWSFDTDAERRRLTAAYVRGGLRKRQRVVYLPAAIDVDTALRELEDDGVRIGEALASGQLRVAAPADSYLAAGKFDGEATRTMFTAEVQQALADGWTALRALGDMLWGASGFPGAENLAEYEREINRLHAGGSALGVCLYDRRLFPPALLREIYRAHPVAVTPWTPRTVEPMLRTRRTPAGLRIDGEVDLSNRDALITVLAHLRDDMPAGTLTLDLTELAYADGTVCRAIVGLARETPLRTVGADPAVRRLLELHGAETVPGLLDAA